MKRHRGVRLGAVLVAALLCITGCGPTGSYTAGQPQISVDPSTPCPHTLGPAQDVHNSGSGLSSRIVPPDRPSGALVCVYRGGMVAGSATSEPQLQRTVRVGAQSAGRLARDLARVSLSRPHGTFNCPAELPGSVTVIAFGYGHRSDVDLWFSTTGCQTLDNGYVIAYQAGNTSFYDHFQRQFDALTR